MELKRNGLSLLPSYCLLLIVPYGIETHWFCGKCRYYCLLIVPYGIETYKSIAPLTEGGRAFNCTLWNWNYFHGNQDTYLRTLLIVPYGIETININRYINDFSLLIVPYGIETSFGLMIGRGTPTFNCTLWNWNDHGAPVPLPPSWSFNCTLWNWNLQVRRREVAPVGF